MWDEISYQRGGDISVFVDYCLAGGAALEESDIEEAVIGHGPVEGPYTEIDGLEIERDPDFPVRVTVQFYLATSNGVVSRDDIERIKCQLDSVYADAEYVGSLVTEGHTNRPAEYVGEKDEPPQWWEDFWRRHEENSGRTREETLEMLRDLRGHGWVARSQEELQTAIDRARTEEGA